MYRMCSSVFEYVYELRWIMLARWNIFYARHHSIPWTKSLFGEWDGIKLFVVDACYFVCASILLLNLLLRINVLFVTFRVSNIPCFWKIKYKNWCLPLLQRMQLRLLLWLPLYISFSLSALRWNWPFVLLYALHLMPYDFFVHTKGWFFRYMSF